MWGRVNINKYCENARTLPGIEKVEKGFQQRHLMDPQIHP